ncbi:MAG: ABC transporter permease, partial [Lysobacter sp.]|nr:ABC transporter permease [Lysobacter sp.]
MDFRPILSTLRRHKTAAALIVLEVALSCAIVSNALFLIGQRLERMQAPTGLAEAELLHIRLNDIARRDNAEALTRRDLATLRALPGVKAATSVNHVPFGNGSSDSGVSLSFDQASPTITAALYLVGENALATLGLKLVEGRDFLPEEVQPASALDAEEPKVPAVILDRGTAARLFPEGSAIGKSLYVFGPSPMRVVGVVEHMSIPQPNGPRSEFLTLLPVQPSYNEGNYLVRVDAAQRDRLLKDAVAALQAVDSRRIVMERETFDDMRHEYFRQDRWMAALLVAVCIALLVVTAFGIVGLASFWVQQRTRMIGVRRALGASRVQILRYFQAENFLLTTMGIAIGMTAAYGINRLLMSLYELPPLPWVCLPIGAVTLWALGQVAVL